MIKLKIFNSISDCEYKIEFNNEKAMGDGTIKKNVSLIYASNTMGKSTLSSIIENHFNNLEQIENRFTKIKSSVSIIQTDDSINKVYKYDREFATKSMELYRNELVISPKSAHEIVNIKNKIDENKLNILNAYKKSETYKELVLIQDERIKKSKVSKLFLKKYNDSHANDITELLRAISLDTKKDCYSYEIKELIDLSLVQSDFLVTCQSANDEVFTMIKENFPEIDMNDSIFYKNVLEYLSNNKDKLLNKLCVMCGKTQFTEEIINERMVFLSDKINDYNQKMKSNEFFKNLSEFSFGTFYSELFINFQKDIYNKEKNDLIISLSKIGEAFKDIDIKQITANAIDCILDKIREEKNIFSILSELNNLYGKLKKLKEDNKEIINEETKRKFVDNLEKFQFKYFDKVNVDLDLENSTIIIKFHDDEMKNFYSILSESEKSILSFSLFKSIIQDNTSSIIIVDDPVDSHDQRNKWFILNNIIEIANNLKSMIIIMTHDLSLSKTLNQINSSIHFTNFILSKKSIDEIKGPSLFFSDIYDFVFDVFCKVESSHYNDNEKYFLPLAFLIRYLSKNQFKLLNEINQWHSTPLDPNTITRELTKRVGFKDISNDFVHYKPSIDSNQLLDDVVKLLKLLRKSTGKPAYFRSSISTDLLIEEIINDIGQSEQFDKELSKIMSAILIRNIVEKKFILGITRTTEYTFSEYAKTYHLVNGNDPIYAFYLKNKAMVDEFAHLESGIDALLTYDIEYIQEQLAILKSL